MFEAAECYSGDIVPAVPAENFEDEVVSSRDRVTSNDISEPDHVNTSDRHQGNTPDLLMQNAYREAERIVMEAKQQAEQEAKQIVTYALEKADEISAKALAEATSGFGLDLWSSRYALADIVEQALREMIGQIGEPKASYKAVEVAIAKHCADKEVTVSAERGTADRLRLVELSKRSEMPHSGFKIVTDDSLSQGRCLINSGGQLLEVSIESQLAAIRDACNQHVAASDINSIDRVRAS